MGVGDYKIVIMMVIALVAAVVIMMVNIITSVCVELGMAGEWTVKAQQSRM
jgi:hypothetical protein